MKPKELTHIAFLAVILYVAFQLFANVLYLEMITFTLVLCSCLFPKREVFLASVVFAMLLMLTLGITPWTLMYLLLYPCYAIFLYKIRKYLLAHRLLLYSCCGLLSFLTGQLLQLPFLLFSKQVTMLYMIIGLKTSILQGGISFIVCLFLFDPLYRRLQYIAERK